MLFKRTLETRVNDYLKDKDFKIFFIWGPRRSGKTTVLKKLSKAISLPIFNFDMESDKEKFVVRREVLEKISREHKIILIDEIQNFPQATVALKILHDLFKVKIVATGSSELRQKSGQDFDSLAGRFTENYCLPFSLEEIAANIQLPAYERQKFHEDLAQELQVFGAYPEIYTQKLLKETQKIELLQNLFEAYVLKDIIKIYDLKNTKLAKDILTKIALQLGSEVSLREIAGSLQANVSTVANYVEIFIKNYILIPLPSFKTNLRRAVSENRKLYFYDLGLRNILVKDFRELNLRPDKGGVFENFIVAEMEKRRRNLHLQQNLFFYREYGGQEVDLVLEDYYKKYTCIEMKYLEKMRKKKVFPLPHRLMMIDSLNYFEQISKALPQI